MKKVNSKSDIKKGNIKKDNVELKSFIKTQKTEVKDGVLLFKDGATLKEVANATKIPTNDLLKYFFLKKENVKLSTKLSSDQIAELAINYNLDFKEINDITEGNVLNEVINSKASAKDNPDVRPPIITIMGHIDHGKTTLLDTIKKTNYAQKEAGGITQSIGAYQILFNKAKMTFIDTPGHEAFTNMRARGSQITDIVIVVVAANDSIMPQTKESIEHAKSANIPIIIAINKIDLPSANPKKVKDDLIIQNLFTEKELKDIYFVEISAKNNKNIDKLLETINFICEVENYKTKNDALAAGTVIETHQEKGKGNVVSIIVQYGTLEKGDSLILDSSVSNIRLMYDENGNELKKAPPSTPVKIIGFADPPDLGSKFIAVHNVKEAKKIAKAAMSEKNVNRVSGLVRENSQLNLKELMDIANQEKKIVLPVIMKADSKGSLEVIENEINKILSKKVKLKIIRSDIGALTKSDILLAVANDALVYSFNLNVDSQTKALIKKHSIKFLDFNVIYDMIENVANHLKSYQEIEYEKKTIGKAKILKIFVFSKIGSIAGSRLEDGKITANAKVRLLRNKEQIYEGDLNTLQIESDKVKEVIGKGKEFAFTIKDFNDIKEDDIAEFYILKPINVDD